MIGWILFALLIGLVIGFWLGLIADVWNNIYKYGEGWEKHMEERKKCFDKEWNSVGTKDQSGRRLP